MIGELRLDGRDPPLRRPGRARRARPGHPGRRVHRPARPFGLRQDDRAQLPGRPAAAQRRLDLARRRAHRRAAAGAPRLRHGVPELRAVPAPVRAAQRGVRARDGTASPSRSAADRVEQVLDLVGLAAARREVPGAALRRPAAARGDRPRGGDGAVADADGRAAVEPRREAAPGDADGDPAAAPAARPDDGLRHPRPGGGALARRPARAPARRRRRAGRAARGALPAAGERLRGGLHGLPQPARDGGRESAPRTGRSSSAPRGSSCAAPTAATAAGGA